MDNQTEELWLAQSSENELGTGVFLLQPTVARPFERVDWYTEVKSRRYETLVKALVGDMTYQDCVHQGLQDGLVAFKWVPYSLAGREAVIESATKCQPVRCVKRCAQYGCICAEGVCR